LIFKRQRRILGTLVDQAVLRLAEKSKSKRSSTKSIHPSTLVICPRRVYYYLMEEPFELVKDPRGLRILENGTKVHERFQTYFQEAGILLASESSIKNEDLWLSGKIDAIVTMENTKYVVELKSIQSGKFKCLTSPLKAHMEQIQLYMHCTGIHKGIVIYENKDTQETCEFEVNYDPEIANSLINRILTIQDAVKTKQPPARVCKNIEEGKWKFCEYCPSCF